MPVYTGTDNGELGSGEDGFDVFDMKGGRDTVFGAATDDTIYGGTGIDWLYGGAGADLIISGLWADLLYGGTGADRLFGGVDEDSLYGGADGDWLTGGLGDDFLYGDDGDDRIFGGTGRDILFGGDGNDVLSGGVGGTFFGVRSGNFFYGGAGNDRLFGQVEADVFEGGLGNDLMVGGAGNDQFYINGPFVGHIHGGDDTIYGGAGADEFVIDLSDHDGSARIGAGGGIDSVELIDLTGDFLASGSASVMLPDGSVITGAEVWTLYAASDTGRVDWQTGAGDDLMLAADATGRFAGGAGNDRIEARDDVTLLGEGGSDALRAYGNATLYGGAGNDELNTSPLDAGPGSRLYGGTGDDRLQSAFSLADTMTGDADADTFVLVVPNEALGSDFALDTVTDFVRGTDKIGLYATLDIISDADPQATGDAAMLLFDTETGLLSYDANGSAAGGVVDLMILQDVTGLGADDFILTR